MTTFVSILSAKGGVGKTTTAINLACALTHFGREVILIDGNYTKPNVGLHLGITSAKTNLHHSLKGQKKIQEAIVLHPSGIQVIPGSIVYDELYEKHAQSFREVMLSLMNYAEIIIIDGPAGLGEELQAVVSASDKAILVTTPDISSITDTLKTKRICTERGCDIMGIVVTHSTQKDHEASIENIQTIFEAPVIGEIPFDEQVRLAQAKKYPVVFADLTTPATIAYKKLAANLIGEEYTPNISTSNLFEYLLEKLGFR